MRAAVILLALCAVAVCVMAKKPQWHELDTYDFSQYVKDFGKRYRSEEATRRQALFEAELERVRSHNKDGSKTWKEGVNHMSDWSEEEFRRLLGYDKNVGFANHVARTREARATTQGGDYPAFVDWRNDGIVTDVKDQGQCGSCWSFASAETVESLWARKTGSLHVLSEQMILSCVPNPKQCGGTGGCAGGTAELAYQTLDANDTGLPSEWTMPYLSYHGEDFPCTFDPSPKGTPVIASVSGYTKLQSNGYEPLMDAITNIGPIAISVEAIKWKAYESGVFDGCNQTNPDIDHAVQLVGYGTESGQDYWLVRNSWSPAWGDQGYIKILRSASEETRCGTDITPQDGTGCSGGPKTVQACGTCGILFDSCYPSFD